MKRIVALILSMVMLLTSCGQIQPQSSTTNSATKTAEDIEPHYTALDDKQLLAYIEDVVYRDTITSLDSDKYFVENVSASYLSKEYLVKFPLIHNLISTLDIHCQNWMSYSKVKKYVFTLSEDGKTTVQELQEMKDTSTETMLKNVAIGTGVILICVTVSIVSAGVGAPAVSMIFAASAKTATTFAVSSAAFGGISAGIVRGIQTGDFNEATEAAATGASEGFKWGAIGGTILGGGSEAFLLKSATKSGLTMNEAALIQADSELPINIISQMHSLDEYMVYKKAGLKPVMVNGKTALLQEIDLNYVSQLPDKTKVTNLVRMQNGYPRLTQQQERHISFIILVKKQTLHLLF